MLYILSTYFIKKISITLIRYYLCSFSRFKKNHKLQKVHLKPIFCLSKIKLVQRHIKYDNKYIFITI